MRKVEVGDKIVVTKFYGKEIEPTIRTVTEIKEDKALMKMDDPIGHSEIIEHDSWIYNDNWRFAVRKGDRLIVTRICEEDVEPTEVIAAENEWEVEDGLISIDKRILPNNFLSDILDAQQCEYDDVWHFSDEYEEEAAKEVCGDICDSYNDVESEYVPQSFADFNASTGGGKTLKDYTGVDITAESIAFEGNEEKALKSITSETLAFTEKDEEDAVNHPDHYNYGDIEVIDMLEALSSGYSDSTDAYLISTAAKYLYRADHKGNKTQDWKKAVWYIERAIEREEAYNE